MENFKDLTQQQKANRFWNTYFHDLLDSPIDEQVAIDINLWERLQTAFTSQDKDTLWAVVLMRIEIPIQTTDMALRVIRLAKRAIDNNDE
jgi:hypothetical protein